MEVVMAWFYLIIAGLFEVVWAYFMKQSEGFSKFWPGFITVVTMLVSFFLLSWSMKSLPLGTAYAIWTGIGAIGAFVVGVLWLGESANALRVLSVLLVIAGLVGLKLSSA
jgi:quaternary ammonium compound-resistance protein SugE